MNNLQQWIIADVTQYLWWLVKYYVSCMPTPLSSPTTLVKKTQRVIAQDHSAVLCRVGRSSKFYDKAMWTQLHNIEDWDVNPGTQVQRLRCNPRRTTSEMTMCPQSGWVGIQRRAYISWVYISTSKNGDGTDLEPPVWSLGITVVNLTCHSCLLS